MKKSKKIIYSLGLIGIAIPAATIISCGENSDSENQEEDQKKLNEITSEQIVSLFELEGKSTEMASTIAYPQNKNNISINELGGVTIYVNSDDWTKDDEKGEVRFSATARKSGLSDHIVNVTVGGYNKDQGKLNSITAADIISEFAFPAEPAVLPSTVTLPETSKSDIPMNGLEHVTIDLTSISPTDAKGQINLTAVVSTVEGNLKPHNVDVTIANYKTTADVDQDHIDFQAINGRKILEEINFQANPDKQVDDVTIIAPDSEYLNVDFDQILGVKVTTTNWTAGEWWTGDALFDAELSVPSDAAYGTTTVSAIKVSGYKVELTSANINDGHLLKKVYEATEKSWTVQHWVTIIARDAMWENDPNKQHKSNLKFEANSRLKTIIRDAMKGWFIGPLVLPDTLESIGIWAFQHDNFDSITFGENLKLLGEEAFRDANLDGVSSLVIPGSVTTMEAGVFRTLSNLTSLTFNGELPGSAGSGRQLTLGIGAFGTVPISGILGSDWQAWAGESPQRDAFKA